MPANRSHDLAPHEKRLIAFMADEKNRERIENVPMTFPPPGVLKGHYDVVAVRFNNIYKAIRFTDISWQHQTGKEAWMSAMLTAIDIKMLQVDGSIRVEIHQRNDRVATGLWHFQFDTLERAIDDLKRLYQELIKTPPQGDKK